MPDELLNLADYEFAARQRLERMVFDYYASGAMDEITLRENQRAFGRLRLRYRVLQAVSRRDLSISLLGRSLSLPVLVAPTAFQRMAHPDGELATARAAAAAGSVMVLSTLSNTAIEEVARAARQAVMEKGGGGTENGEGGTPLWFQLYVYRDRGVTEALVRRAEAAGCEAIAFTVDAPLWGRRERDVRNRFRLPKGLRVENLLPAGREAFPDSETDSGLAAYVASMFDPGLSWADLEWLCALTRLPVLVKGIVHPADARLAAEHGAAGVVVSNHGGRQLDSSLATIEALPGVAEAVAGVDRREGFCLILDGGVRRGTDVVKAIALGADAVAVGRPVLWGLAVAGEQGVAHVLTILRDELDLALGLCGCPSVADVRAAGEDLALEPGTIRGGFELDEASRA